MNETSASFKKYFELRVPTQNMKYPELKLKLAIKNDGNFFFQFEGKIIYKIFHNLN